MSAKILPPSQPHLKRPVLLVNKIMAENPKFKAMIKENFGGPKLLREVARNVRFDESLKLPAGTMAETWREVPPTDLTIFINWRFKAQGKTHHVAIENKRLDFVLAITILHEICHLCLRKQGRLNTPPKLLGRHVPEAGEFFEKILFGGLITMRLNKDKQSNRRSGWDPSTMDIDAVLLQADKNRAILDSEIEKMWDCVDSKHPFPSDLFPLTASETGRKVGQHALKRADGVHEGLRSCKFLKGDTLDICDTRSHVLDRIAHSAPSKKLRR